MRVLPSGSAGLLVEVDSLEAVLALHRRLRAARLPGVVDLVPAARTVLLVLDPAVSGPATVEVALQSALRQAEPPPVPGQQAVPDGSEDTVVVPVVYDGEDLAEVAALTGQSPAEVVSRHTGTRWVVAFSGFAPGFGYVVPVDGSSWDVPRRAEPRTRVPAGSVGLAGGFSGVYPRSSPGGWQLIGRTDLVMFDPDRDPPALLRPGVRVRFVDVGRSR